MIIIDVLDRIMMSELIVTMKKEISFNCNILAMVFAPSSIKLLVILCLLLMMEATSFNQTLMLDLIPTMKQEIKLKFWKLISKEYLQFNYQHTINTLFSVQMTVLMHMEMIMMLEVMQALKIEINGLLKDSTIEIN